MGQDKTDQLVFIDVDAHIFSDVLVASDRAAISSDFRVAQDKIHQEKRENGEDKARVIRVTPVKSDDMG